MEHDLYSFDTSKEQPEENSPTLQHAAVSQAHPPSSFTPTTLSPMHAFSAPEPLQENSTPHPKNIFDVALEEYYSQTSKMLPRPEGAFAGSDQPHNNTAVQEHRDSTYSSTAFTSSQQGETVSGDPLPPPDVVMSRSNTSASESPCHHCKARETLGKFEYVPGLSDT
ncbi:hypothetical protein BJX65DRAFT_310952 [Aspergillus insuetus]